MCASEAPQRRGGLHPDGQVRADWTRAEIQALIDAPFMDLVGRAAAVHRTRWNPSEVQLNQLLSIKTGGCAEDCGYCSQSAEWKTGVRAGKLMDPSVIADKARAAKAGGAQRYCMGAARRELMDRGLPAVCEAVAEVSAMDLQTCMTLGMLTKRQAEALCFLAGANSIFVSKALLTKDNPERSRDDAMMGRLDLRPMANPL